MSNLTSLKSTNTLKEEKPTHKNKESSPSLLETGTPLSQKQQDKSENGSDKSHYKNEKDFSFQNIYSIYPNLSYTNILFRLKAPMQ